MVSKRTTIKLPDYTKKRLDELRKSTNLSYAGLLQKYLPKKDEYRKSRLLEMFEEVQKLYPELHRTLEWMRLLILNIDKLEGSSKTETIGKMESELNELYHKYFSPTEEQDKVSGGGHGDHHPRDHHKGKKLGKDEKPGTVQLIKGRRGEHA